MPKLLLALIIFLSYHSAAQDRYEHRTGDPNGIGKWYMGRQIAQVMSHFGVGWLERSEREKQENSSQLIRNLDLAPGMVVADVGAGSGYHTSMMSPLIGHGTIYAVDIEPAMITYIRDRISREKLSNVKPVLGNERSLPLPANSLDLILMVDVYHEVAFPYEMGQSMLKALKPGGKLFLIEFRAEDPAVPIREVHKMTEKQAVIELKEAGFTFIKNIGNLPWQHCMVFTKSE